MGLVACNSANEGNPCGHPNAPAYSCPRPPFDSGVCVGAPDEAPGAFGPLPVGVGDASYSVGCTVTLPFCHPYYPAEPATCDCAMGEDGGEWVCPQ